MSCTTPSRLPVSGSRMGDQHLARVEAGAGVDLGAPGEVREMRRSSSSSSTSRILTSCPLSATSRRCSRRSAGGCSAPAQPGLTRVTIEAPPLLQRVDGEALGLNSEHSSGASSSMISSCPCVAWMWLVSVCKP